MSAIDQQFYLDEDVVTIARNLIGKVLYTRIDNHITAGIISETEAYQSVNDKASHAYQGKRTIKNEAMYLEGGSVYVYICYGIHHMLNIVTNRKNIPDAVLIRGISPLYGINIMEERRKLNSSVSHFSNGPGKVCVCLDVNKKHNGMSLGGNTIWIEDENFQFDEADILNSPRIGIDYAKEDAELMYRFVLNSNQIKYQ